MKKDNVFYIKKSRCSSKIEEHFDIVMKCEQTMKQAEKAYKNWLLTKEENQYDDFDKVQEKFLREQAKRTRVLLKRIKIIFVEKYYINK